MWFTTPKASLSLVNHEILVGGWRKFSGRFPRYRWNRLCLTPFLTLPSQTLLPSSLKLQNFTTRNGSLMIVCVQIWHLFHISDRRYRFKINFCVFNERLFAYCRPTYFCLWTRWMRIRVNLLMMYNFGLSGVTQFYEFIDFEGLDSQH